jgi:isochorismate synthase EntC
VERDFWLSLDLLRSDKDDREFRLVRDWIRDALASCAERIEVEVPKSVIKQVRFSTCGY